MSTKKLWRGALLALTMSASGIAGAQDTSWVVPLHSRKIRTRDFAIGDWPPPRAGEYRTLIQLRHPLSPEELRVLHEAGVRLIDALPNLAHVATVLPRVDLGAEPLRDLLRWTGPIEPADRRANSLAEGFAPWSPDPETRALRVTVMFHSDVTDDDVRAVLGVLPYRPTLWHSFEVLLSSEPDEAWAQVQALSEQDLVRFVEPIGAPAEGLDERARRQTKVDSVTYAGWEFVNGKVRPSYRGVTGKNTCIGVCDNGMKTQLEAFEDAQGVSRVKGPNTQVDDHATRVAGVAGGNGVGVNDVLGQPKYPEFAQRGVAPEALLANLTRIGGEIELHGEAVLTWGATVLLHPYSMKCPSGSWGEYSYDCLARSLDALVAGEALVGSTQVPPTPNVWSAGNYAPLKGYHSLSQHAKNAIVVGALELGITLPDPILWFDSSLGPTWDGRIKPDVVAPGSALVTVQQDGSYGSAGGTSMSAPIVAGVVALMQERRIEITGSATWLRPATIRALLVLTADDLDGQGWTAVDTGAPVRFHAGPDYATGFGLVDAAGADRAIREQRHWERDYVTSGSDQWFSTTVAAGTRELAVVLTWDDAPASALIDPEPDPTTGVAVKQLVDDLDLVAIHDVSGRTVLPWTLPPLPHHVDPITGKEVVDPTAVVPATRTVDDRNNVELVTVCDPEPGLWWFLVRGTLHTVTSRPYSLAASQSFVLDLGPSAQLPVPRPLLAKIPFHEGVWSLPSGSALTLDQLDEVAGQGPLRPQFVWESGPGLQLFVEGVPRDAVVRLTDLEGETLVEDREPGSRRRLVLDATIQGKSYYFVVLDRDGAFLPQPLSLIVDLIWDRSTPLRPPANTDLRSVPIGFSRLEVKNSVPLARTRLSEYGYGLVQLNELADAATRRALRQDGIELRRYLGGTVYSARFSDLQGAEVERGVRWAGPLSREQKLHPALREWLDGPEPIGSRRVRVRCHRGTAAQLEREVRALEGVRLTPDQQEWEMEVDLATLRALAGRSEVELLDLVE